MGCDPVTWTWKWLQSACHLKLRQRCVPSSVWWATTGGSSKGMHALHTHSANIWLKKGASRNSEWVSFTEDALKAFETLKQACITSPFVLLLPTQNHSCWILMHPRMDWWQCCHRSRQGGGTTLLPMAAEPLHLTRRTTTQLSSSF